MNYSRTNERLAVDLKEQINEIRDVNKNWLSDESVVEMIEEIESVGYFYDEDSWDVYPNDDEYYDETPLDLYVNDDDYDNDDDYQDYDKYRSHFDDEEEF